MSRFDIKSWRKSVNGKAYTIRIGSAWTDQKGVLRLQFDALPVADDKGQVQAFLEAQGERVNANGTHPEKIDDEIPW
jgi:hypothetical protein